MSCMNTRVLPPSLTFEVFVDFEISDSSLIHGTGVPICGQSFVNLSHLGSLEIDRFDRALVTKIWWTWHDFSVDSINWMVKISRLDVAENFY